MIQSIPVRRAVSAGVAIFIAVIADYYFSSLKSLWVPLITLLIMQTTVKTNLRLGLHRFIGVALSVAIACLLLWIQPPYVGMLLLALFVGATFLNQQLKANENDFTLLLLIATAILMVWISYPAGVLFYTRMHDVALGGIIGLLAGLVFLPGRSDVDFRQGIIPVLKSYSDYLLAISHLFLGLGDEKNAAAAKYQVEKVLQSKSAFFPDWVYQPGFNLALRQGHRHFLIRIEQMGEMLFAMHHIARESKDPEVVEKLREPIMICVQQTTDIMTILISLLALEKSEKSLPDFGEEIIQLEKAFQKAVPLPLELLDMSLEYVHMAAFIYDLKDLQRILLKLAEALR